jgi:hypothetical protein
MAEWDLNGNLDVFGTDILNGGHFEPRSGSLNIILKIEQLWTIHAVFALNWLTGFRGEDF